MSHPEDQPDPAPNTSQNLREQAEQKYRALTEALPAEKLGIEETQRLIYELRVHQIELEIQNEQLRLNQEELAASRERFVDLYDFAPVGYCTVNKKGMIVEANLTMATQLAVARSVLLKSALSNFILPEDQDIYYHHRRVLFTTNEPQVCELRFLRTNGPPFWARIEASKAQDQADAPLCRLIVSDITENKLADAERQRLLSAIEQSGETIVITDDRGSIQYVNSKFEKETGYSREEVIGQNPRILQSGKQDKAFYRTLWSTISGGDTFEGRMVNRRKDGTLYTEFTIISPVLNENGTITNYIANKRDITDYLHLESQLRQAHKLEAVGLLAGGVAHEYNNTLSVILGFTELAMDKVDPAEQIYDDLQEISTAATRSAEITSQLLTFARKQMVSPQVVDLNKTVGGMLKMLKHLIGEDIELIWQPIDTLWPVRIDPSQVNQILANLCVNSRHAINGVGEIEIETNNTRLDSTHCAIHTDAVPGEYVRLIFRDNGCGISKADQEKIFEPFFTTKGVGEGTGLGLSTVFGIVKQNSGFISVDSEPDQGTTFTIYLPRHTEVETKLCDATAEIANPLGHGETVLIVEDEVALLELAKRILKKNGYIPLGTTSVSQALELAQEHKGSIQLLITDLIMPMMNGHELADRLKILCPGIKVLFISGYSSDIIAQQGAPAEEVAFLPKPFTQKDLLSKVQSTLAGNTV